MCHVPYHLILNYSNMAKLGCYYPHSITLNHVLLLPLFTATQILCTVSEHASTLISTLLQIKVHGKIRQKYYRL